MSFVTRSEFREILLALFDDIHHLRKDIRNFAQRRHAPRSPQEHVSTVTKIDSISSIETRTPIGEQTQAKRYQFWSLFVQWSTFGAVVIYATVAAFQWWAMKEANTINRDSLTASQQPWVGISDVVVSNPPKFSSPPIPNAPIQMELTANYTMRNAGLSAAKNVDPMWFVIAVGEVGWPPKTLPPCGKPDTSVSHTFLMPQDKIPLSETITVNPQYGAPNEPIKLIRAIWLEACITYQDRFGKFYQTKVVYHSFARDDSPELVAVTGRDLRLKPIQGWNLWSADFTEVEP